MMVRTVTSSSAWTVLAYGRTVRTSLSQISVCRINNVAGYSQTQKPIWPSKAVAVGQSWRPKKVLLITNLPPERRRGVLVYCVCGYWDVRWVVSYEIWFFLMSRTNRVRVKAQSRFRIGRILLVLALTQIAVFNFQQVRCKALLSERFLLKKQNYLTVLKVLA